MHTYSGLIAEYSRLVAAGQSDKDLTAGQQRLLARLLAAVAAGHSGSSFVAEDPILTVVYPPSDQTRDDAVALLRRIVRDSIARPDDFGLDYGQWDATVARAAECLKNI